MKDCKIIFLTGHTKFRNELIKQEKEFSLQGHIVIDMDIYNYFSYEEICEGQFKILVNIHKEKIELADGIFIFNKDQILGELDNFVIEHAKKHNKIINYLEPIIKEGDEK